MKHRFRMSEAWRSHNPERNVPQAQHRASGVSAFCILHSAFCIPGLLLFASFVSAQVDTGWVRRYDSGGHGLDSATAITFDMSLRPVVTGTSETAGTGRDYLTLRYNYDGTLSWARRFAGPVSDGVDCATAVAADGSDNSYVTGYSAGVSTGYDMLTIKYYWNGDTAWARRYDGPVHGNDKAWAMAVDATGNVYVTGESDSTTGASDIVTIKYNSSGVLQWVQRYGFTPSAKPDIGRAIAVDRTGNVFVVGSGWGMSDNLDCITIKYNASGGLVWERNFNGAASGTDAGLAVATDTSGNIYVAGEAGSSSDSLDCLLVKYLAGGDTAWARTYDGPGHSADVATAVKLDNAGNVFVTGSSAGSGTGLDYATLKYSSAGALLQTARYDNGVNHDDAASALQLDKHGDVFVTGRSQETSNKWDYATVRYDNNLNPTWVARYSAQSGTSDMATALAVNDSDAAYVTGCSKVSNNFDYLTIKYIAHDVGATAIISPPAVVDSTSSVAPACSVYNYGTFVESYTVRMKIGTFYNQTASIASQAPGAAVVATFPAYTAWPRGSWPVTCSTELTRDINNPNDRVSRSLTVHVWDVAATSITAPTGTVDSGTPLSPSATVRNNGNALVSSVRIDLSITGGYTASVFRSIAPGAESTVVFPAWTPLTLGPYDVKCTTRLGNDVVPDNNRATGSVTVVSHDAGVVRIVRPVGGWPAGAVVPQAIFHNYGSVREATSVTFAINSAPPYLNTVNLPAGVPIHADTLVSFASWNAVAGHYVCRCSTGLANDQRRINDTLAAWLAVGSNEVGVTSIVRPIGSIVPSRLAPQAKFRNYGSFAVSFPVFFNLLKGGSTLYADSQFVTNLTPGTELSVVFDSVYVDTGTFLSKAKCVVFADSHPADDSMLAQVVSARPPPGWDQLSDVPFGSKGRRIKDGGCLAALDLSGGSDIYCLKGNNTCEFYSYNLASTAWATRESIPAIGRAGKKHTVKKGGAIACDPGHDRIYALKGGSTTEFWSFMPDSNRWRQRADVPLGAGQTIKQGSGLAFLHLGTGDFVYLLKGSSTREFWRFDVAGDSWHRCPDAPGGLSGAAYKDGSCIAAATISTDSSRIYALKASYNEFFAFDPAGAGVWTTKGALPQIGRSGTKRKNKSGGALASPFHSTGLPDATYGTSISCLKGNNTQEFWSYFCDSDRWTQLADLPLGTGKRVKGGGGLAATGSKVYAIKGNNTLEFWTFDAFGFGPLTMSNSSHPSYSAQTSIFNLQSSICNLSVSPNPVTSSATINFTLPEPAVCRLGLYDVAGNLVTALANGHCTAGTSSFVVRRSSMSPGIYLLKLEAGTATSTTKLIVQ